MVLDSNDTNLVYEEGSGLMKCENCNNIIDPSYNACPYCGNLVKKTENVQANDENLNVQPNMNVQPNASNMNSSMQPTVNNINSNIQPNNNLNAQQTVIGMSSYARSNNGTKRKNKGLIAIILIVLVVINDGALLANNLI